MNSISAASHQNIDATKEEARIRDLLSRMTLAEKIGQMNQLDASSGDITPELAHAIKAGEVGSLLNVTNAQVAHDVQGIATADTRLGIPLLIARDVIHGFKTVMPIPLGQAASFNPDLIEEGARHAAREAREFGINWTFAPMVDVSRDPRWGRIAESGGEDPVVNAMLGTAMVRGFQGDDLAAEPAIAACAKHYVGYGTSEGGRDYNSTPIPPNELRNVYLPPFKALADAGVASFMTSFGDIDGIPASGNAEILQDILRQSWGYDGLVISDWDSVRQLVTHGLSEDERAAALECVLAGVDIEMVGGSYLAHLQALVENGTLGENIINDRVANILRIKLRLGLFDEEDRRWPVALTPGAEEEAFETSRKLAQDSIVLLQNNKNTLPLDSANVKKVALLGPMADQPAEQMGTWVFDGDASRSVTPLTALKKALPDTEVIFHPCLTSTRDRSTENFASVLEEIRDVDAIILCVGEDAILSGEAHCRADISLPGAQSALLESVYTLRLPTITVVMAGRSLVLTEDLHHTDALMYAWHGGSGFGPALVDLLLGKATPSGKLPVSLPVKTGQVPIYHAHRSTGRPPIEGETMHIDHIPIGASQTSLGMTSFYLDAGYRPLFPFGFGLTYSQFEYSDFHIENPQAKMGEPVRVRVRLTNIGDRTATEIAQLYIRDRAGSLTRPVKEFKAFKRATLAPSEALDLYFELTEDDLAYSRRDRTWGAEAGWFDVWIGTDSRTTLGGAFHLSL